VRWEQKDLLKIPAMTMIYYLEIMKLSKK